MSVDYYALLGVPKFCSSQDEIRRAYLAQARFFHPDAGNVSPEIAHQKMQQLNTIYDTLKDPDARRLYDAKLLSLIKAKASPSFSTSPAPPTQPPRHASRALPGLSDLLSLSPSLQPHCSVVLLSSAFPPI